MAFKIDIGGYVSSAVSSVSSYAKSAASNVISSTFKNAVNGLTNSLGVGGTNGGSKSLLNNNAENEIYQVYSPSSYYQVLISSDEMDPVTGNPISILGWYGSEQLSYSFGSSYEAPFAQGLLSAMGAPTIEMVGRLYGVQSITKDMTAQIWQGSDRLHLDVPLIIAAQADGQAEIQEVIRQLAFLSLASETDSKFLRAPGPRPNLNKALDKLESSVDNTWSSIKSLGSDVLSGGAATSPGKLLSTFQGAVGGVADIIGAPVQNPEGNISIEVGNMLFLESIQIESVSPTIEWIAGPNGEPMFAQINIRLSTFKIPTAQDMVKILRLDQRTQAQGNSANPDSLSQFGSNLLMNLGGG